MTRVGKTKVFRTPLGELRPDSLLDSNVSQNSSRNLCPKYPPLFSFQNSIAYPFDGLSVRKFPFLEVTPNRLGQPRALCYQYGGESESGLGPIGSPDNWRCVVFEKLRRVELLNGSWKTAPNHSRPATCVVDADIDAEDQPERDPQNRH